MILSITCGYQDYLVSNQMGLVDLVWLALVDYQYLTKCGHVTSPGGLATSPDMRLGTVDYSLEGWTWRRDTTNNTSHVACHYLSQARGSGAETTTCPTKTFKRVSNEKEEAMRSRN